MRKYELIDSVMISATRSEFIHIYRYGQRYMLPSCCVDRIVLELYRGGEMIDSFEPYTHNLTAKGIMIVANEGRDRYFCSEVFSRAKDKPLWATLINLSDYVPIKFVPVGENDELPF